MRYHLLFAFGLVSLTLAVVLPSDAAAPGDPAAAGEIDPAKAQDIRTLLEITRAGELAVQAMSEMLAVNQRTMPQVPAEFWQRFREKATAEAYVDLILPIYDRHLTHDQVRQLIEFYRTPIGQTLVEKQPLILRESMQAGEQWGRRLGTQVATQLQAERASGQQP